MREVVCQRQGSARTLQMSNKEYQYKSEWVDSVSCYQYENMSADGKAWFNRVYAEIEAEKRKRDKAA